MWTELLSLYPAHTPQNIAGNPLIPFINTQYTKSMIRYFHFPCPQPHTALIENPKEVDFKLLSSVNDQLESQSVKKARQWYLGTKIVVEPTIARVREIESHMGWHNQGGGAGLWKMLSWLGEDKQTEDSHGGIQEVLWARRRHTSRNCWKEAAIGTGRNLEMRLERWDSTKLMEAESLESKAEAVAKGYLWGWCDRSNARTDSRNFLTGF